MMMKKQQMMANAGNSGPQLDGTPEKEVDFEMKKKRQMMKEARRLEKMKRRQMRKAKKDKKKRKNKKNKKDRLSNSINEINGPSRGPPVDCMVTPWSEWSECTQKCGKEYVTRSRMIKLEAQNGGKKCPRKLKRRKKCKLPKCRKY